MSILNKHPKIALSFSASNIPYTGGVKIGDVNLFCKRGGEARVLGYGDKMCNVPFYADGIQEALTTY